MDKPEGLTYRGECADAIHNHAEWIMYLQAKVKELAGKQEPEDAEWKCPHCGHDESWFDRELDEHGNMGYRCEKCGKRDDELMEPERENCGCEYSYDKKHSQLHKGLIDKKDELEKSKHNWCNHIFWKVTPKYPNGHWWTDFNNSKHPVPVYWNLCGECGAKRPEAKEPDTKQTNTPKEPEKRSLIDVINKVYWQDPQMETAKDALERVAEAVRQRIIEEVKEWWLLENTKCLRGELDALINRIEKL